MLQEHFSIPPHVLQDPLTTYVTLARHLNVSCSAIPSPGSMKLGAYKHRLTSMHKLCITANIYEVTTVTEDRYLQGPIPCSLVKLSSVLSTLIFLTSGYKEEAASSYISTGCTGLIPEDSILYHRQLLVLRKH